MSASPAIEIRIWGARGTFPMVGQEALEFGGHTACVEVRAGGRVMIFDAGSGIIPLGKSLLEEGVTEVDLFFSHVHYDHIIGLPYFLPAFWNKAKLRIWAGHMQDGSTPEHWSTGSSDRPISRSPRITCAPTSNITNLLQATFWSRFQVSGS